MIEALKIILATSFGVAIIVALAYFTKISERDAMEMGIITPEMERDPEFERLKRETPLNLEEAVAESKKSAMADKEISEEGIVQKKRPK
jgi:hypothetical protein